MRCNILQYRVTSPLKSDELSRLLIQSIMDSTYVNFEAIFVDNPSEIATPETFSVKVESVNVSDEYLMFDVVDLKNHWIRLIIKQDQPIIFESVI